MLQGTLELAAVKHACKRSVNCYATVDQLFCLHDHNTELQNNLENLQNTVTLLKSYDSKNT